MLCTDLNFVLTTISSILACLLLISEMLPYATSSRCNSVLESVNHVFSLSCLISNKGVRTLNTELIKENNRLQVDNSNLTDIIDNIKTNVVDGLRHEIVQLRNSFDEKIPQKLISRFDIEAQRGTAIEE